eukprot:NODE_2197_length_978_cov_262.356446.p4 GENE.NODE_2197_length_978_cov_262.356446~~NODE_2197_length_978_cov_262.356446.p4  ORF type:complete len:112 (-),score=32.71 NODE_2197_length_978_cov_262.356446:625-960(-)
MGECGRGSFATGFGVLIIDSVVFFVTRIGMYGYLNYCITVMYFSWPSGKFATGAMISYTLQLLGCQLMLIIQIVFQAGVMRATRKFWTNGGVHDMFHDKSVAKARERRKRT